jgi:hypothetical protein
MLGAYEGMPDVGAWADRRLSSARLDVVAGSRAQLRTEQLEADLVPVGHAEDREGDRAEAETATADEVEE